MDMDQGLTKGQREAAASKARRLRGERVCWDEMPDPKTDFDALVIRYMRELARFAGETK